METVLVTGASDGIGLKLVEIYLSRGMEVIATGRRVKADLPSNFPKAAIYVQADQTDLSSIAKIIAAVENSYHERIKMAVLNAGVGFSSDAVAEDSQQIDATLTANLDYNITLSHALFPYLEGKKNSYRKIGQLAFIGSVAHKGAQLFPTYAASKAGLHGLARALYQEWGGRVNVQIIHPGPTKTSMHEKAGFDATKIRWMFLSPDWMARHIAKAIDTGKPRVKLSHGAWFMSGLRAMELPLKRRKKAF